MTDDGWQVEAREAPAALSEDFQAPPFDATSVAPEQLELPTPEPLHAGRDWVSLAEKLDAGGMALLMRFGGTIGEPDAGTTNTV